MKKLSFTSGDVKNIVMIVISSLLYSFGMNTFVHSGNLFPGGYAGIGRLLSLFSSEVLPFTVSFSIIYFALNILTTLIVWKRIGHKFILKSLLWFTLTSLFTALIPYSTITEDKLLIGVFGGLINGFAIGIALQANASSGGTDFIAIDLSNHLHKPSWNYIFAGNVVVLLIAGLKYGWNQALYSIIFQYVSTQVVNLMHQRYKMTRLQIITDKADKIADAVFHTCRHGITKIGCEGEYSHVKHDMLLITVNTYQVHDVIQVIQYVDPKAFISVNHVDKIIGNYYQKPLE
jgi:uncharacterized membrane-anchored protein YitT (DUF2179 family)